MTVNIPNIEDFKENNIAFRVISSKLLERYKQTQSFVLAEIEYGEYKFTRTSKEIALMYLDTIFDWLLFLERKIIRGKSTVSLTVEKREEIWEDLIKYLEYIDEVIKSRPSLFNNEISSTWMKVRFPIEKAVREYCSNKKFSPAMIFYTQVVNSVIDGAEELRLELYEIDYLKTGGKAPFVCITDIHSDSMSEPETRVKEKVETYKNMFNVDSFIAKNYTASTPFFNRFAKVLQREIKEIKGVKV